MLFKTGSVISRWDIMPTLRCYQNTNYFDFYLCKVFKSFCGIRNCYMFKTKKKSSPSASSSFICSDSQDARTINDMLAFLQDKYCSFSSYLSG